MTCPSNMNDFYRQYLNKCVQEGALSEGAAREIVVNDDWRAVSELIDHADRQAEAHREIYGEEWGAGQVASSR